MVRFPKYTIQILNHNKPDLLNSCLASIFHYVNTTDTQVIVIDNGSDKQSLIMVKQIIEKYKSVEPVYLEENYGIAKSRNIGLKKTKGEYCLILDNDTIWQGNVLDYMGSFLRKNRNIGVVGMCGVLIPELNRYIHIHSEFVSEPIRVNSTTGYCMLIRKDLIEKGIKFDEGFRQFMWEDIDLCFQIASIGYDIYVLNNVPLNHLGHGSREFYQNDYHKLIYLNYHYLYQKWIKHYQMDSNKTFECLWKHLRKDTALKLTGEYKNLFFYDIVKSR